MGQLLGNNFWEGVVGVVQAEFEGLDLGKTTADTEIKPDADILDITYQQDGTKPADRVRTGMVYVITMTFGEIDTALLKKLISGISTSGDGNSVKLGRSLYQSMKTNEAGLLKLSRIEDDGTITTNGDFILRVFKACPNVTSSIVYGAAKQRDVQVEWYCFWDDVRKAFGYSGSASSVNLT
jgi:hypothetical protein